MGKQSVSRKVCVVVASRANYGRIKSVLKAIQAHPKLELQVIVAASALLPRFGNLQDIMRKDGIDSHTIVYYIVEGENPTTMAKSTGLGIIELATQFEILKPDVVLTVADRFETMATAVAASYMNIPLAHTQGGDITGSIDESVRHAISKLAHIHFPATDLSAKRLMKMGEDPARIKMTGCPSIDLIHSLDTRLPADFFQKHGGVGGRMEVKKPYLVVLQHPVTTEYGKGFAQINETLEAVAALKMQTAWLWPNVDAGSDDISKGLRVFREKYKPDYLHFFRNFPPEEYAKLIANAECLIGNSSSGLREGCFLGTPVVNIGTRQQGRERGANVVDAKYDAKDILAKIKKQLKHGRYPKNPLFGDGQAGARIAQLLAELPLNGIQKKLTY
jgi:UDP-hydrolysing UDP-N-acetyl-D-glucosamine 2-epimerase